MRFFVGLPAMQILLATSKLVVCSAWLPLSRELLSVCETEGEKIQFNINLLFILSLRLLLRKIHPLTVAVTLCRFATFPSPREGIDPRQREAKPHFTFFIVHRLTFIEPRDYRVVFVIQKNTQVKTCVFFIL